MELEFIEKTAGEGLVETYLSKKPRTKKEWDLLRTDIAREVDILLEDQLNRCSEVYDKVVEELEDTKSAYDSIKEALYDEQKAHKETASYFKNAVKENAKLADSLRETKERLKDLEYKGKNRRVLYKKLGISIAAVIGGLLSWWAGYETQMMMVPKSETSFAISIGLFIGVIYTFGLSAITAALINWYQ